MFYPGHNLRKNKYFISLGRYWNKDYEVSYDLGVHKMGDDTSFAIIYGKEPHQYISGPIVSNHLKVYPTKNTAKLETLKRYEEFLKSKKHKV